MDPRAKLAKLEILVQEFYKNMYYKMMLVF